MAIIIIGVNDITVNYSNVKFTAATVIADSNIAVYLLFFFEYIIAEYIIHTNINAVNDMFSLLLVKMILEEMLQI